MHLTRIYPVRFYYFVVDTEQKLRNIAKLLSKQLNSIYHVSLITTTRFGFKLFCFEFGWWNVISQNIISLNCFILLFFFSRYLFHTQNRTITVTAQDFCFQKREKTKFKWKLWEKLLGMCLSLCSLLHTAVSMDKILHTIHSECVHPQYFHPSRHRKCMLKLQTNSQTNTRIHCRRGAWIEPVAWLWIVPTERRTMEHRR